VYALVEKIDGSAGIVAGLVEIVAGLTGIVAGLSGSAYALVEKKD